jgi:excisionase family DNA binding protein
MSDERVIVFTAEEVAVYLRTSLRTVRRLIREGELVGVKVGRSYRVTKPALDDYLKLKNSELER